MAEARCHCPDPPDPRKLEALRLAQELCASEDCQLLWLTFFGSELYGTSTKSSDTDLKGIFLPSLESVILGKAKNSLRFSTGPEHERNHAGDMDLDLWSLSHWLLKLLPSGDTGALDLLFSASNPACVVCRSPLIDPVFANPLRFLDLAHNRAYAQYSVSQAKKYGIKGSMLGALRRVEKWLDGHDLEGRLEFSINEIMGACGDDKYCFPIDAHGGKALVLCGKTHMGGIKLEEFKARVKRDMAHYGARAKQAENNQGLDFKALSHALRALDQMEELLKTGAIHYPLASREKLKLVKQGAIPWPELEGIILKRLEEVGALYERLAPQHAFDREFAENFILSCYGLGPKGQPCACGEKA